jgi:hypothetical protein
MTKAGTFNETPENSRAYNFSATENGDGSISAVSLIDAGNVYSNVIKIEYIKIPK